MSSKTISRVLSWTIIYLGPLLPMGSSDLPKTWRATTWFCSGLATAGVYICPFCYQKGGSLLHYLSILTFSGGLFLLH